MSLSSQATLARAFCFGDFELHPERTLLLRSGMRVKLQPQPLRVLACLVQHAPAIVSRDDLALAVWSDVHVDLDQSLNYCIRQIRAALEDSAVDSRFVETLPKQGYRFIADLKPLPEAGTASDRADDTPSPLALLPAELSSPAPISSRSAPPDSSFPSVPTLLRRHRLLAVFIFTAALGTTALLLARRRHAVVPPVHTVAAINPEAHDACLRGRYLWFRGANEEAGQAFRRAIELQPDYALAWSGLADYYGQGAGDTLDARDALPKAEIAARRAVQLDPNSANAHLSLGACLYFNRWDWAGAQREIDRALRLDPRLAQAIHFRAKILSSLERHTEAIATERTAAEIDPFARPWGMTSRLLLARRFEDAHQSALNYLHADPTSLHALASLEESECAQGKPRECVAARTRRLELSGNRALAVHLRRTFAQGGYHAVLRSDLADLRHKAARQYVSPFAFATQFVQLGQRDDAVRALQQALDHHDPNLLLVQDLAIFDPLHNDPRYRAIIHTIGLPSAF